MYTYCTGQGEARECANRAMLHQKGRFKLWLTGVSGVLQAVKDLCRGIARRHRWELLNFTQGWDNEQGMEGLMATLSDLASSASADPVIR